LKYVCIAQCIYCCTGNVDNLNMHNSEKILLLRKYTVHCGLDSDDEESKHSVSAELKTKLDQQYYKSLDGFLIVIAKNGDIIYVSENIEKHLGLTQVCLRLMHEVFKCVLTVHCCIVISNDEQTSRDVPDRDVHYPTETG